MSMDIEWSNLEEAREIIDLATLLIDPSAPLATYKSADDPAVPGNSEISAEVWAAGYEPPSPYIANTTRNLQFNQSHFIASPDAPDGVTTYVTTSDGYSWAAMSKAISAMWPYTAADYSGLSATSTYYAGNLVTTPAAGVVKVTANYKAQDMKFWANEGGAAPGSAGAVAITRHFVTDEWGNEYIMHASGQTDQSQVAAAFAAAVLPAGWTKSSRTLTEDLILNPAQGSDGSYHYLVFRDSADNTYHQIGWSSRGSLSAQVDGMPIWGGQTSDVLAGDAAGVRDDVIHAAGGDDRIVAGAGNDTLHGDAGNDTLEGGAGLDVAVFSGSRGQSTVTIGERGTIVVAGPDGTDALSGVELLRFGDGETVSVFAALASEASGSVYRFYSGERQTHFYTASQPEAVAVMSSLEAYQLEGIGFATPAATEPGATEVYRFLNTASGGHFYTSSTAERAQVLAMANYVEEGVAYFAFAEAASGRAAVHRFHNDRTGSHFYTANEAEYAAVLSGQPDLQYEGVAFYASA